MPSGLWTRRAGVRVNPVQRHCIMRTVRYQSSRTLFGRPLVAVAFGPNYFADERRGHARGIIAIGDVATGWLALGALARGFIAVGGLAFGGIALGGLGVGIIGIAGVAFGAAAIGGFAAGGIALGGVALGVVAVGGVAVGSMALGGLAIGESVASSFRQDPAAVEFFSQWLPRWWLP